MRRIEQAGHARQVCGVREFSEQPIEIRVVRLAAKIGGMALARQFQTIARAADHRRVDQAIILQEAEEHAGKHPVDSGLIKGRVEEGFERLPSTARIHSLLPFHAHRVQRWASRMRLPQIGIDHSAQPLEVG